MQPLTVSSGRGTLDKVRRRRELWAVTTLAALAIFPTPAWCQSEVPAGTRFMVGLSNKLDVRRIHRGKRFTARTLEPISTKDGGVIPAGAKVEGRATRVNGNEMRLGFEKIDTRWGSVPLIADVVEVVGEHNAGQPDSEGNIRTREGGTKPTTVAALNGVRHEAASGPATAGRVPDSGQGTGMGAVTRAPRTSHRLVLGKGTRLEVELEDPLVLASND